MLKWWARRGGKFSSFTIGFYKNIEHCLPKKIWREKMAKYQMFGENKE